VTIVVGNIGKNDRMMTTTPTMEDREAQCGNVVMMAVVVAMTSNG
jgi:hypothetical protein